MKHKVIDTKAQRWIGYNPETGELFETSSGDSVLWHKISPFIYEDGYKVHFNDQRIFMHNLAWYIMTDDWPAHAFIVRHKDGNQRNNRWGNLYKRTFSEDSRQHKKRCDNSSGYIGVTRYRNRASEPYRYFYKLIINGKIYQKCGFSTPREAALARDEYILEIEDQFATLNILKRDERQVN